ncbi:MAG: LytTR family DNA-binding domain-containing protein [Candidatus Sulfotelmatobacter sp.]
MKTEDGHGNRALRRERWGETGGSLYLDELISRSDGEGLNLAAKFLDVDMTEPSDVGLRGHLTRADRAVPAVGAVTPKDEHVIADFEKKTADQGLNPFSSESLAELLTVSPRRATAGRTASVREVLRPPPMPTTSQFSRIAIKANGTILFIDSGDIIAIEVKGNYLSLLHKSGSYILHESITMAEKKLNLHGFVRIHRSVLVNAAFVEELRPWSTGKYVIRLKGGKEYKVTRTYKTNLQFLAGSWIGTDGFATK